MTSKNTQPGAAGIWGEVENRMMRASRTKGSRPAARRVARTRKPSRTARPAAKPVKPAGRVIVAPVQVLYRLC